MSYGTLREKIAAESAERKLRYAAFAAAYDKAVAAGRAAGEACSPRPMIVTQHVNALDDGSPAAKQWYAAEGACGFAWVKVFPGNCSFAKWLIKQGIAKGRAYAGGVDIWVSAFGQSIERKQACASAMAKVLVAELGVKAYADSRLD